MDADPICEDENVAELCYEALIGSDFEKENGWHINLMPDNALREFRADWKSRSKTRTCGNLTVLVPSADDLLVPKLKRGEPRDHRHFEYAKSLNLLKGEVNL